MLLLCSFFFFFFFFNDTATTEIYTLSLHDALPICKAAEEELGKALESVSGSDVRELVELSGPDTDRKSTRLNSSHSQISYAVFCLKKKKKKKKKKHIRCKINNIISESSNRLSRLCQ